MKIDDSVWGALLVALGAALFLHVQGFPTIPGQRVGPSAMPGALAVGFAVCGAIMFVRGLRARTTGQRLFELPHWFGSRPQVLGFAVLVAVNLLYLFAVDRLGFIVTGTIYLAALMWVLRVRRALLVPIAFVLTLAIHYCFYKLLRVPLPWGLLQPIAW